MGENQEHYPRDLRGYAGEPPHARWPGGARIAVQFVLNYEEGAENHVLHGDAGSEQFLSDIIGAASYPARHMSMDSLYEYGSRAGFWRIHREFSQRGLPLTVFGVAMALARHPEIVAAVYSRASLLEGKYQDDGSFRCTVRIPGAHSGLFAPYSCSKFENKVED